jgi:hypothetical protein
MQIKYYKTDWEDNTAEKRCRFEMLSKLIDDDVKNHPGLKPRLMHITDRYYYTSVWVVAIVVWE